MPRTAPIPNIPAIPGMNPGVWVMSGGGDSGGGSGNEGNASASGQGANGQNGGNSASGGAPGAGKCGPGAAGGCPNPIHGGGGGMHAGDPVDPISGRVYTTPVADLELPGPLPFLLERMYSSHLANDDVGLGWGWTHSYAFRIHELPHRKWIFVDDPYASRMRVDLPRVGQDVVLQTGILSRTAHGYVLDRGGLLHVFRAADAAGGVHRLSRIVDENGNAISLYYDRGELSTLLDAAGRVVRVVRDARRRVQAFEVRNARARGQWVRFRSYEYDDLGRMVAAKDADGNAERYAYDDDHRLVERRTAAGLSARFVYDARGRCVETWCERAEGASGLDPRAPSVLADGTPAKGFLHVKVRRDDEGGAEVVTSRGVRRIEGNAHGKADKVVWAGGVHTSAYDGVGNRTGYRDAEQNAWAWEYDEDGLLRRQIDPLGGVVEHEYDDGEKRLTKLPDGSELRYTRDRAGNPVAIDDTEGPVVRFDYDARGLLTRAETPNHAVTEMRYDDLGNRVEVREPDGASRRIDHDGLGRVVGFTDERGHRTSYLYDSMGRLGAVRTPAGETRYEYDADGELVGVVDPDGRPTRFERGGFGVVTAVLRPDGARVSYLYDREQDLSRIVDEVGAEHVIERDAEGRIVREETFDGRTLAYKLDGDGRIVRIDYGGGEFTELAYDAIGRLVKRAHSDDVVEEIEYDAVGRVVRATSGDADSTFAYDARGNIVAQRTSAGGRAHEIATRFDAVGKPVRVSRPDGTVLDLGWDLCGRATSLDIGGAGSLRFEYDPGGGEIARHLPEGGRIERTFDALGRVTRLAAGGPPTARPRAPGEPAWLGSDTAATALLQTYTWTPGGDLAAADDAVRGRTADQLDRNGRIVRRARPGGREELYGYDAKGSLYEPSGGHRRYERGGRLVAKGEWTYGYDALGRLVSKRRDAPGAAEEWRYEWSVAGRLLKATGPDVEVAFVYDAFARRLAKTVKRAGKIASDTTYAWDGDALVGLREEIHGAGGVDVIEWSFVQRPADRAPIASRRRVNGVDEPWTYWIASEIEPLPLARLDGAGRMLDTLDGTLLGRARGDAPVPLRYPGQVADTETGLHYNRHRYYDPEAGVFLSPEPLGLEGGLLPYAYAAHFPQHIVDPSGLVPVVSTVRGPGGRLVDPPEVEAGSAATNRGLHPAVAAALPNNNARDRASATDPTNCGEPHALSDYLYDYERRNGVRCDPSTARGRRALRKALRQIQSIQSEDRGTDPPTPRAPCPNCSQTISRLYGLAGLDPPRSSSNGPETQGSGTATRVARGARVQPPARTGFGDMGAGAYESPHQNSDLQANNATAAAANSAAYQQAVAGTSSDPRATQWQGANRNANPVDPNRPLPDAGYYQHDGRPDGGSNDSRNNDGTWTRQQ